MSAVFDSTSVGKRMVDDRKRMVDDREADSHFGDHANVLGHKQRMAERVDADEKAHPDNVFGPEVER